MTAPQHHRSPLLRCILSTGAAAAVVITMAVVHVPTASAAAGSPITGIGGKCVDVASGNSANGTRVQLWTCNGGAAQQWTVETDGTIRALGKCLDVAGASTANGARAQIYDCNGTGAQRWMATAGQLVNTASGKCLDAANVSSADGTQLQIWSCNGGVNQRWTIATPTPTPTPTPTVTPTPTPTPTTSPVPRPGVGQCTTGATYGNPLPSTTVTATKIRDGFNFLEGPVWDATTQTLLLSSMRDGAGAENVQPADILKFTAPNTFETFIAGSGSNGLALSRDGSTILAATHDQRSVSSYRLQDKARGVVASSYQGHAFNSPNDLTIGADGTVYFTDPDFQRANRSDQMSGRTSVFRVKNGVVSLIDDTIREPNGIALSPDGKTLYVGGNGSGKVYKYPVNADGSVGSRSDFASLSGSDGSTIDCAGNLYQVSYSDAKVHVYAPSGAALGTISAGASTTNVAFGGSDGKTLYITSGTASHGGNTGNFGLYSVRLNVPGWPY
ncbi:SMP-30/gluconolactonase/LRE family protein [Sphaerisporangium sp. NPDC088356]|uniref:SMP-30/gluconolactonase/LRE family protein n=1 Tax=Sphaerisporangium sp. NPDC088356 TaxID=3154871 RepID=UPI003446E7F4